MAYVLHSHLYCTLTPHTHTGNWSDDEPAHSETGEATCEVEPLERGSDERLRGFRFGVAVSFRRFAAVPISAPALGLVLRESGLCRSSRSSVFWPASYPAEDHRVLPRDASSLTGRARTSRQISYCHRATRLGNLGTLRLRSPFQPRSAQRQLALAGDAPRVEARKDELTRCASQGRDKRAENSPALPPSFCAFLYISASFWNLQRP